MKTGIRIPASIAFLLTMTVLTGIVYPLVVTGAAQIFFPKKANGSQLVIGGGTRGSALLAQDFRSPGFFKARPSATGYVWVGSGASNLALTNPDLAAAVSGRRTDWQASFASPAPADMLYASASGLDPDISPEAALAQLPSVAKARDLDTAATAKLEGIIREAAASKTTLLGPPRVNVVELNAILVTEVAFEAKK